MEVGRESLQQRYADLNDAELLRRLHSVELTELAREVLLAELKVRGVSTEPAPANIAPAGGAKNTHGNADATAPVSGVKADADTDTIEMQDSGIELAADRFTDNPYQAPRAPRVLRDEKAHSPSQLVQVAWWIYIALLVGTMAVSLVVLLWADATDAELMELAPSIAAAVGLVGWRLRKPLLHPLLWVACLAVFLAQAGVNLQAYIEATSEWPEERQLMLVSSTLSVLVELPLIWGLVRYAFLSRAIWQPAARRGA